jgi:hypothetical protein
MKQYIEEPAAQTILHTDLCLDLKIASKSIKTYSKKHDTDHSDRQYPQVITGRRTLKNIYSDINEVFADIDKAHCASGKENMTQHHDYHSPTLRTHHIIYPPQVFHELSFNS